MRLKAERRLKLHVIKLHYDSLARESLEPSELMVTLLREFDCVFEIQSSLKEGNCLSEYPFPVGQWTGGEETEKQPSGKDWRG